MADEIQGTQVLEQGPLPEATAATPPPVPEGMVNEPPDPAALQAEIERLKKVREEAEEKALYWRKQKAEARADYFKGRGEPPPQPPRPEDLGIGAEPKQDAFDDYQKYLDAKIAFEVNKAKVQWDQETSRKAQDQARQQRIQDLHMRLEEGFKKYTDFEEVALDKTVPITPVIMDILAESEQPHELAYYLGRNRAEAIQISRMTPIQASRKLAQIEAELTKAGGSSAPQPKITNAPPPIRPVGASNTVQKNFDNMTQREFEAEMEKRTGRRY